VNVGIVWRLYSAAALRQFEPDKPDVWMDAEERAKVIWDRTFGDLGIKADQARSDRQLIPERGALVDPRRDAIRPA